jgi:transcriptional regulator with XRE-family HTH domain
MKSEKYSAFVRAMRKARESRGMTQEVMARELGVTLSTYTKWEQGVNAPDFEMTGRLLSYFGADGWVVLYAMGMSVAKMAALCDGFQKNHRAIGRATASWDKTEKSGRPQDKKGPRPKKRESIKLSELA